MEARHRPYPSITLFCITLSFSIYFEFCVFNECSESWQLVCYASNSALLHAFFWNCGTSTHIYSLHVTYLATNYFHWLCVYGVLPFKPLPPHLLRQDSTWVFSFLRQALLSWQMLQNLESGIIVIPQAPSISLSEPKWALWLSSHGVHTGPLQGFLKWGLICFACMFFWTKQLLD